MVPRQATAGGSALGNGVDSAGPAPVAAGAPRPKPPVQTHGLQAERRAAQTVRCPDEGTNSWESHLPFGGRAGSQSSLGRVGGRYLIERLTELKTVVVNLA